MEASFASSMTFAMATWVVASLRTWVAMKSFWGRPERVMTMDAGGVGVAGPNDRGERDEGAAVSARVMADPDFTTERGDLTWFTKNAPTPKLPRLSGKGVWVGGFVGGTNDSDYKHADMDVSGFE